MKLTTTDTQHHALWRIVNEARDNTTHVKVEKASLKALLQDHGALVGPLEAKGLIEKQP